MKPGRTKTVTLIRHAKSSWRDPCLADFERPLNRRGMRDAPRIAAALSQEMIAFDSVLCSDAQRAKQTLSLLKQALAINEAIVEYRQDLYGASASHLLSCLHKQPDFTHEVVLLAHNPGVEELANYLSKVIIGPMPTCGVVRLRFKTSTWRELSPTSGEVVLQLKPKSL